MLLSLVFNSAQAALAAGGKNAFLAKGRGWNPTRNKEEELSQPTPKRCVFFYKLQDMSLQR